MPAHQPGPAAGVEHRRHRARHSMALFGPRLGRPDTPAPRGRRRTRSPRRRTAAAVRRVGGGVDPLQAVVAHRVRSSHTAIRVHSGVVKQLVDRVEAMLAAGGRVLGIAGPPGSGKSTLAERPAAPLRITCRVAADGRLPLRQRGTRAAGPRSPQGGTARRSTCRATSTRCTECVGATTTCSPRASTARSRNPSPAPSASPPPPTW